MNHIIIQSTKYGDDILCAASCESYKNIDDGKMGLMVSLRDVTSSYIFDSSGFDNGLANDFDIGVSDGDKMITFNTKEEMIKDFYKIIFKKFFKSRKRAMIKAVFSFFKEKDIDILNYILEF